MGDDFLIISAVTDYDDIFVPIAEGYSHIIFLLLLMFLAVMCAAGIYVRMLLQRQKDTEEIAYLKELNGILELSLIHILVVEHDHILKAIKNRHVAEAKTAIREHIDNQEITVSKNIKEQQ